MVSTHKMYIYIEYRRRERKIAEALLNLMKITWDFLRIIVKLNLFSLYRGGNRKAKQKMARNVDKLSQDVQQRRKLKGMKCVLTIELYVSHDINNKHDDGECKLNFIN